MGKILIVEDDDLLRELYLQVLGSQGHEVEALPSGSSVISKLRQFRPNLIILDIILPGKSGIEVLEEIKLGKEFKDIPVLMVTGVSEIEDVKKCLKLGAVGYVMKGGGVEDLNYKVSLIISSFT